MKAIVIERAEGVGRLVYQDIPDLVPGPEDLLVAVKATALNRADLLQRRGNYPQPGPGSEYEVPGLEFAGEVVAIGNRVDGFAPGDRVMALVTGGAYAEQALVHYRHAVKVPRGLSWHEAGATPEVFITAHDALMQCDLKAGESVLIHAAGSGVGTAAVQIAKMLGASQVFGTASSADKLDRARELGLDIGINYRDQQFPDVIKEVTGGRGVDVILDVVGADYLAGNLSSLAVQGRMIIVGLMGGARTEVNLGVIQSRRLHVMGTGLRSRPHEERAAAVQSFAKSVLPHIGSGRMRVVIDRVIPLSETQAGHEYMETNANFGKIVVEP